jgi:hypothetical protein
MRGGLHRTFIGLKKSQPALTMPLVEPNPAEFILYMVVVLQAETRKPAALPR